jgi:hypothetical protein
MFQAEPLSISPEPAAALAPAAFDAIFASILALIAMADAISISAFRYDAFAITLMLLIIFFDAAAIFSWRRCRDFSIDAIFAAPPPRTHRFHAIDDAAAFDAFSDIASPFRLRYFAPFCCQRRCAPRRRQYFSRHQPLDATLPRFARSSTLTLLLRRCFRLIALLIFLLMFRFRFAGCVFSRR